MVLKVTIAVECGIIKAEYRKYTKMQERHFMMAYIRREKMKENGSHIKNIAISFLA